MNGWMRMMLAVGLIGSLTACSDEAQQQPQAAAVSAAPEKAATVESSPQATPAQSLTVILRPAQPTSSDTLQVSVTPKAAVTSYQWAVNDEVLPEQTGNRLSPDFFRRDDEVTVQIESAQGNAATSVLIGNSPPRITEVAATTDQVLQRGDITITPQADDADGDEVKFRYQWLINGEEDLFHTEETLPGNRYVKGDTIQVRVTPYDEFVDGTVYESAILTVPNAPPQITSQPPKEFTALEYVYQVEAADPDNHDLVYRLDSAPPGMTISAAGLINWPLQGVAVGDYTIRIKVEDVEGAATTQEFTLTLGKPEK